MSEVKVKAEGGDGGKDREVGKAQKKGYNFKGPQRAKFEGKREAFEGAIYDCSDVKQADIFVMTTKDLSNYVVGQTMRFGGDMRIAVVTLKKPVFPLPKLP